MLQWTPLLAFLAFAASGCNDNPTPDYPPQPNILWLVCEDQSDDFFPMYGDRTTTLPNLTRLAEEGVVYTNMNATVPVCSPARSGIITGMYPTSIGTHNMRAYNPYNALNEPSIGIRSYSPVIPAGVKCFTEYLRLEGYYCSNNSKEDYNFETPEYAWDDSGESAHWRNRQSKQPFFAVFNFNVTHESQIWGRAEDSLWVSPEQVTVPPYFPDNAIVRKDLAINYTNLIRLDRQIGEIIAELKEDGLYDNTIIFFYSDHGGPFPRYKRSLYETGLNVPLIVRNPYETPEKRLRPMAFPGEWPYATNGESLSFIDFAPTVLSLAGIEPPEHMQGIPFMGTYRQEVMNRPIIATSDRFDGVYDRVRAIKMDGYKYIRNYNPELPYALPVKYRLQMPMMLTLQSYASQHAGVTDSIMQWMSPARAPEEFYDLINDPDELVNLIHDSIFQQEINALKMVLSDWSTSTYDLGVFSEADLMNQWLPSGQKPKVDGMTIIQSDTGMSIQTQTQGATVLWRPAGTNDWNLTQSLPQPTIELDVRIERIGHTPYDTMFTID